MRRCLSDIRYPDRECHRCLHYPCFEEQGIGSHKANFAAYGCVNYRTKRTIKKKDYDKRRKKTSKD